MHKKTIRKICTIFSTLIALLFFYLPTSALAQSAAIANNKYITIQSAGTDSYYFNQFSSFASISSGVPDVQDLKTWGATFALQAITSDGDRWYAILKKNTQNCFVTYTSYEHMMTLKGELLRCNANLPNNGFRGLAYDGKLFHTLFWDGTQHWWQTYLTWNDVINNTPYSKQVTTRSGDIYKSIGYDPTERVFFSMAQGTGKIYLNKYSTFNDMVAVRGNSDSRVVYTSDTYLGMAMGPVNPTLDIYIVAGQSNAVGWGTDGAWISPDAADANIAFFYRIGDGVDTKVSTSNSVTTLQPQIAAFRTSPPTVFGIEMGIGRSLYASGRRHMAIVKVAFGGTTLYSQWNPNTANSLFKILQDNISNASIQWNQAGYRTRIAGFFWMQGEYDAKDQTMADAYLNNLRQLKSVARALSGNNYLPFIVGRITTTPWVYSATVRAAEDQLASEDPFVRSVDTDDLPKSDSAHYDSGGEYTLGLRMGSSYRSVAGW